MTEERKQRVLSTLVKDSVSREIYGGNYSILHKEGARTEVLSSHIPIFLIFLSSIQVCGDFGQVGNSRWFYLKDLPNRP